MADDSTRQKMARKEKELDKLNMLGLYQAEKDIPRRIKNAVIGEDEYGTSLSKGAMYAADEAAKEYRKQADRTGKTRGQFDSEAMSAARQAAREAGAEERREAKSMKKGGSVKSSASKRADGCAIRGKTRGKMV